jgi:hypothetical protein
VRIFGFFTYVFTHFFTPSASGGPNSPPKSLLINEIRAYFSLFLAFFHTFYRTFTPHGAGVFGQYKALHLSHTTGVLEYVEDWGSCSNAVITKKNKSGKNLLDL